MMGMLEGLRAGGADARAAQELAMRQEADRRAAELHAANLDQMGLQRQQLGLQLNRARAIEDAQNNLSGLVKRERENQDFLASGNAGPVNPVTERDFNSAQMGLATAKGDLKELDTQRGLRKKMDVADEAKRLAADPAFQQKALSFIGDSEHFPVKVVKGKRDPKTGQLMTADTLEFDTGYKHTLKDGDVQRIAYGAALHNLGMPEEATKVFSQVNKELSAAVNTANDRVLKGYDFSSKAEDRVADNNRADQMLKARWAEVGVSQARVGQEDWSIVGATDDNKGLLRFNRRSGKTEVVKLPDGMDAKGMFDKITGHRAPKDVSAKDVIELALKLQDRDPKLSAMGAMAQAQAMLSGQDPNAAAMAKLRQALGLNGQQPAQTKSPVQGDPEQPAGPRPVYGTTGDAIHRLGLSLPQRDGSNFLPPRRFPAFSTPTQPYEHANSR